MTKKEIEAIVEKTNTAYVAVIAYRIKAKTIKAVEYLADVYSGEVSAYTKILEMANVDLDKCGLWGIEEAYKHAKNSLILEGIEDKTMEALERR